MPSAPPAQRGKGPCVAPQAGSAPLRTSGAAVCNAGSGAQFPILLRDELPLLHYGRSGRNAPHFQQGLRTRSAKAVEHDDVRLELQAVRLRLRDSRVQLLELIDCDILRLLEGYGLGAFAVFLQLLFGLLQLCLSRCASATRNSFASVDEVVCCSETPRRYSSTTSSGMRAASSGSGFSPRH
jgi:hypothetical protein